MEAVSTRFDPTTRETHVASRVAPNLCYSLSLPQEWQVNAAPVQGADQRTMNLKAASGEAELGLAVRSARELQEMPQTDLPGRDAAYLQRDYEDALGQPAQAVSLSTTPSGATRWTATWIDANLPSASHALTVETFILPLSDDWLLELSLDKMEARDAYVALMHQVLASVKVKARAACGQG